ncbi:jg7912 [Pararge aegeria aegeria]|uniref:Jg7912 protein n=1 Tax=Pararge aegeria aegeria TaxID=348720 RepID=A0A8S4R4Y7_9NEOP|nr:jg7912 [Pararge aegeria aegeria]
MTRAARATCGEVRSALVYRCEECVRWEMSATGLRSARVPDLNPDIMICTQNLFGCTYDYLIVLTRVARRAAARDGLGFKPACPASPVDGMRWAISISTQSFWILADLNDSDRQAGYTERTT